MATSELCIEEAYKRLRGLTVAGQRLPGMVFRAGYVGFVCIEFDIFCGEEFWRFLSSLAAASGDAMVYCIPLVPDAVDYFLREFGAMGGACVASHESSENYFTALAQAPVNSPADSILDNSEVLVWFGGSMQWIIWGERNLTVSVLGLSSGFAPSLVALGKTAGVELFSPERALSQLMAANFPDRMVPDRWAAQFLQNYVG
jgi:hypothetical protein